MAVKLALVLLVACASPKPPVVENATPKPVAVRFESKLTGDKRVRFDKLTLEIASPCGKAHSLRTSLDKDLACTRAPHAMRFLEKLVDNELPDDELTKIYDGRYRLPPAQVIDVSKAPVVGDAEASVKLVEFFDYQCSHCAAFAPKLRELEAKFGHRIGVFYKNFPLVGNHPGARAIAIAATAAHFQGKFIEMNDAIFAAKGNGTAGELESYATKIGLDIDRYRHDVASPEAAAVVDDDLAQANALQLGYTPTLFINGRLYHSAMDVEDLTDVIEEELEIEP